MTPGTQAQGGTGPLPPQGCLGWTWVGFWLELGRRHQARALDTSSGFDGLKRRQGWGVGRAPRKAPPGAWMWRQAGVLSTLPPPPPPPLLFMALPLQSSSLEKCP